MTSTTSSASAARERRVERGSPTSGTTAGGDRRAGRTPLGQRPRRAAPAASRACSTRPRRAPRRRGSRAARPGRDRRARPTTRRCSPVTREPLGQRLGRGLRALAGCGRRRGSAAGRAARPRSARGCDTVANASATRSASSGRPKNASAAASASDGVLALVGAVQRQEHLVVRSRPACGGRACDRRPPAGSPCTRSRRRAATPPPPASASNTSCSAGSVSPSTKIAPGLTMPAFSSAMRRRQSPCPSVWSWPTFVSTATTPSTTLVASHRPSRPTSTTAACTRLVGEPAERRGRQQLEVRRLVLQQRLDAGEVGEHGGEVVVARSAGRCG